MRTIIFCFIAFGRMKMHGDCIQHITDALLCRCTDGHRVTEAKIVEFIDIGFHLFEIINLIHGKDNGFMCFSQHGSHLEIRIHKAHPKIRQENDHIRGFDRDFRLLAHIGQHLIVACRFDTTGINDRKIVVQPADICIDPVSGNTRCVLHDRDLLAGQGMANAEKAAEGAKGGGSNMFAAASIGKLRAESGSHVTTKGLGLNLGFAKEIENKSGKLLIGPVLEYGHGNYDSYQDNGMKADGKASYWGIGVIAKQTNNSGFYYEGSLRVGRTKSDYGSDSIVANSHISYDSSATYFAAHLGAGMLRDIGHNNTLDYYGRYFYSHTGSDSTTIYRNGEDFDRVNFDGVNSNRIRVGARVTHALNERNKIYGGLAYQYEFSGEARATYREGAAPSPGVKGSSGMIELGWQVKPGKKSPMEIDIGVAGWVGKQRGITANVQANWTF